MILPPALADLLLLSIPVIVAALVIWFRRSRRQKHKQWIMLDGSNIMHWKDGTPDLAPIKDVLKKLAENGYTPCVLFDANAGYLLFGHYGREREFSSKLGLPENQILVVPKGTPADPYILSAARDLGASVITNDRYRDWEQDFPEVRSAGHLCKGGYRGKSLWLTLPNTTSKGQALRNSRRPL